MSTFQQNTRKAQEICDTKPLKIYKNRLGVRNLAYMAQNQCIPLLLREWAPLTDLFDKLPTRTGGIFSQDVKLTCLDVLAEFLVLGTNVGVIFWYDRKKKDLQRLRCENANSPISVIKAVSTVDYMVASGNEAGSISIFQIPKSHSESLPDSLKPQQKQVERYTVAELHNCPITALEWSKNGMKLFSGDKTGSIVLTEIDFYMHVCKSIEILNESYEVVQLSYRQQRLLISTTFRSIICHHTDKWKVCQVGKKDRKVLGKFGGLIHQEGFKPNDVVLYCMRPGLRIWIADVEGDVQKTLLFKDLLSKDCAQVPLLNPISNKLQQLKPQREASFGVAREFCDGLLVTYSNEVVYVLNPENMSILATINNLRSILDIATYKDELFILEEERSLLRISYRPESENDEIDISVDTSIANAEEAEESLKISSRTFDEISNQSFEDSILFKKSRKKVHKGNDSKSKSSNISDDNYTRPTLMNISAVGGLPDLRSPETIVNDIEQKEKILSDVLDLDKLKISMNDECYSTKDIVCEETLLPSQSSIDDVFVPRVEPSNNKFSKSNMKAATPLKQVCNIPNDWNVEKIQITDNERSDNSSSSATSASIPILRPERRTSRYSGASSLSDWEIV